MPGTFRKQVIRLAYENPELRDQLLPMLQKEASVSDTLRRLWEGYKKKHPDSKEPPQSLKDQAQEAEAKKEPEKKKPEPEKKKEPEKSGPEKQKEDDDNWQRRMEDLDQFQNGHGHGHAVKPAPDKKKEPETKKEPAKKREEPKTKDEEWDRRMEDLTFEYGRGASLRGTLIRLAHQNPEMRKQLLPLLTAPKKR